MKGPQGFRLRKMPLDSGGLGIRQLRNRCKPSESSRQDSIRMAYEELGVIE